MRPTWDTSDLRPARHSRATVLIGAAVGAYGLSFVLPTASHILRGHPPLSGLEAFTSSFSLVFEPNLDRALVFAGWLANPASWVAAVALLTGRRWALWPALAAFQLALIPLPLCWNLIWDLPGYWLWLASFGLLLLASLRHRLTPSE